MAMTAPQTLATVLISETFDGSVSGNVKGGRYVPTFGPGDKGWQGNVDQSKSTATDFIEIPVSDGVHFRSDTGTLEFWLKNDRPGGSIYQEPDITYNTVLQFTGDDFILPLYFLPKSDRDPAESALVVWGHDYMKKRNPYGFYNHLGRLVQVGEWIHVALTWGPIPADNNIYIDGQALELNIPENERINFGQWIKETHTIKIGADSTDSAYPDGAYQMYNLVIDDLVIHDDVMTKFDLSRVNPEIESVGHNAFQVAGYSGKLVTGDTYTVTLVASPSGTATFDLFQPSSTSKGVTTPEKVKVSGHPMTEDPDNPGTYRGVHIVKSGEDVQDGQIIGHFTNSAGFEAEPVAASRNITVDSRVYMEIKSSNDLIPADENSRSGITVIATDANGKTVKGHELKLTMSTTDEYTGTVGGGSFEDGCGLGRHHRFLRRGFGPVHFRFRGQDCPCQRQGFGYRRCGGRLGAVLHRRHRRHRCHRTQGQRSGCSRVPGRLLVP
jgi:hypothetical protein